MPVAIGAALEFSRVLNDKKAVVPTVVPTANRVWIEQIHAIAAGWHAISQTKLLPLTFSITIFSSFQTYHFMK